MKYADRFLNWYFSGGDGPEALWFWSGIVLLVGFLIASYYILRRLAGHRKYLGTWYNADQFAALVGMIKEKNDSTDRIMQDHELVLLREHELGRRHGFGGRDKGLGL